MRLAVALVGMLVAASLAVGSPRGGAPRPVLVRMQGHVGEAREGDRKLEVLTLRRGDTTAPFTVTEIWVLSGDVLGTELLSDVAPYTPSLSVSGPQPVMKRLAEARPEDAIELTGYLRRGQRLFMLSAVEPVKKP